MMQKSRTIDTVGRLNRDAFRKITIGAEASLDENDEEIESVKALSCFLDDRINEEVNKITKESNGGGRRGI